MVFSSVQFLYLFLPIVVLLYFIAPQRVKNYILLLASIVFYAMGEKWFVVLLIASIIMNYIVARVVQAYREKASYAKVAVTVGIVANLILLGIFKYTNFIVDNINFLLSVVGMSIPQPHVHYPAGVSFFTFQCISYIVDVYRGQAEGQRNFTQVAVYVAMFPKLIAGPIVRYKDIAQQLGKRVFDIDMVEEGIIRFIIGLGKKVVIADTMGLAADGIFGSKIAHLSTPYAWIGIVAYTLQIYYDFSGYSDMAIGLGRIFGFRIMENFNYPYISQSITEFWRRWHISLSTWFRDYVYIPLGGNREGQWKTYRNLIIVFFLTGLWHGASWTFVLWGMYHGLFLILERVGLKDVLQRYKAGTLYAVCVVMMGWVLFRSPDLGYAMGYYKLLFVWHNPASVVYEAMRYVTKEFYVYMVLGILFSAPIVPYIKNRLSAYQDTIWLRLGIYGYTIVIFLVCFMYIAKGSYSPFIYFGF